VGWYHTHPSFGIFLSHHDLFIHQHFFAQPLQVAYVVDPIQQTRGFFQWRGGNMAQVEGFYLTAERGDRISLARVANDLESLSNPQEHGGGALSPRLEAELIKMLTRPSAPTYAASAVDRFQIAAVFGMLGSMLGVLGVAAGLWLYQLHGRMQEQADALKALAGSVDQVAGGQRLAIDSLLERAGIDNPASFAKRFEKAVAARDEARKQLTIQQTINETLGARTKDLESQAAKLAADLEVASKLVEEYKADAIKAPELREQVAKLEQASVKLQHELDEKTAIADTVEGKKNAEILQRLNLFRYAAYFCGVLSVLLALAVGYLYTRPLQAPDSEQPVAAPEPHRIA
jgi:hypothetical protein